MTVPPGETPFGYCHPRTTRGFMRVLYYGFLGVDKLDTPLKTETMGSTPLGNLGDTSPSGQPQLANSMIILWTLAVPRFVFNLVTINRYSSTRNSTSSTTISMTCKVAFSIRSLGATLLIVSRFLFFKCHYCTRFPYCVSTVWRPPLGYLRSHLNIFMLPWPIGYGTVKVIVDSQHH